MDQTAETKLYSTYERLCKEQLALCNELESLADSLAGNLDRKTCEQLATAIAPMMFKARQFEEEVLYPALEAVGEVTIDAKSAVQRLRLDPGGDQFFALELAEVLFDYAQNSEKFDKETTGYMLRGFFDGVRRRLAFETEIARILH